MILLSDINKEFEDYWQSYICSSKHSNLVSKKEVKDLCRYVYIDLIVSMRCGKYGGKKDQV